MNAIVEFQKPRLPFHPAVEERFGVDRSGWKVLVEAIFPAARTVDSVTMALGYCKARKLDPFKRPVHIVPVWDSRKGDYVETVWPAISELRTTASRTKQYAGIDEVEFGPAITRKFTGMVGRKGDREEITVEVTYPEWGKITVYRFVDGHRVPFHSPKIYWLETYAKRGQSDIPNEQWTRRPYGQFEKCIEAAGLRRAFPEEIGNEYAAEEMEGQRFDDEAPAAAITPPSPPSPPPATKPAQAEIIPPSPKAKPTDDLEIPAGLKRTKEPPPAHDEDGVLIDDSPLDRRAPEAELQYLLDELANHSVTENDLRDWVNDTADVRKTLFPPDQETIRKAIGEAWSKFA